MWANCTWSYIACVWCWELFKLTVIGANHLLVSVYQCFCWSLPAKHTSTDFVSCLFGSVICLQLPVCLYPALRHNVIHIYKTNGQARCLDDVLNSKTETYVVDSVLTLELTNKHRGPTPANEAPNHRGNLWLFKMNYTFDFNLKTRP